MLQGAVLEQMYLAGQERWPELKVERSAFEEHCRRVLGDAADPEVALYGAELYLCCACGALDRSAMSIVEREGAEVMRLAILRINPDPEFVAETLQEAWDKLFITPHPKIVTYSARGPLSAWLRVVATRTALDRCRAHRLLSLRHADLSETLAEQRLSAESSLTRARYQGAFQQALKAALGMLSARERNLLRMNVVGRCNIDQIGRAYGVHRATAARWLDQARTRVFEGVRAHLAQEGSGLSESEIRSIAHLLDGELELNLSNGAGSSVTSSSQQPSQPG